MRYFAVAILLLISCSSTAAWNWPVESKSQYIDRCSASMASQGLSSNKAFSFCKCFASGLESNFDANTVQQALSRNPNPSGNIIDRKLYRIVTSCGEKFMK